MQIELSARRRDRERACDHRSVNGIERNSGIRCQAHDFGWICLLGANVTDKERDRESDREREEEKASLSVLR